MEQGMDSLDQVLEIQKPENEGLNETAVLEPRLMEIPEYGEVLVGGDPFGIAGQLDDNQGDNVLNAQGDCGLVSVTNILRQAGMEVTEDEVVLAAVGNRLCSYSTDQDAGDNGGTNVYHRQALLSGYGIPASVYSQWDTKKLDLEEIAEFVEAGHGVNISVNAGYAWNEPSYINDGGSNHSIIVTGTVRDPDTGELKGLIVCDSGIPGDSSAKVLSADTLRDAYSDVPTASALITDQPICA
ncbi:MAG: hypothetical protein IK099_07600 [Clostridia bacterium]|nr:hypothetical protein [Clostridia bacterium]